MSILLAYEALIRFGAFAMVLIIMLLWESYAACRPLVVARSRRMVINMGLVIFNSLILRVCLPFSAVGVAILAEQHTLGLFQVLALPWWLSIVLALFLLDLLIYAQHILFHRIPLLWRLHQVHHADIDIDVTTGVRFHPLEIILSMLIKMLCVMVFGIPVVAVILFEILLNACAMFNHANIRLPKRLDQVLRLIIVTPDMHRVHHSTLASEYNRNFGFSLALWDRWFGTYCAQPSLGHQYMQIGLPYFREAHWFRLSALLQMPFRSRP